MKVNIPEEYFELFKWFDKKPLGRVATLPIHSFWGWNYYSWPASPPASPASTRGVQRDEQGGGYQGAGFTWFGIKQPILEREFDRWNPKNEQYYREMSQAVYSQNLERLEDVTKKYDITYLLIDKNIIAPDQSNNSSILFLDEITQMLDKSSNLQQVFSSEDLLVYENNIKHENVQILRNLASIGPESDSLYDDYAYYKYRDYISFSNPLQNSVFYPNRNIINNQNLIDNNDFLSSAMRDQSKISIQANISENLNNDCPSDTKSKPRKDILEGYARYTSSEGSFCDHFSYPTLPRNQGYLISITSKNIQGLPLRLCVTNYLTKRCDLYTQLSSFSAFNKDVFLLPPLSESVGFDINFNNFGVKGNPSINDLRSIEITPFDYERLLQIEEYKINKPEENEVLVLSEAFDSGWRTYEVENQSFISGIFPFLGGKELKEHVLVNNWANGWIIDSEKFKVQSSKFVIVFWPQYLEYLGFVILILTFAVLLVPLLKKKQAS